jgi:hypothetical protein
MEQRYLIDTNVIIDYFGNKLPLEAKELLLRTDVIISAVTQIEVLGWKGATEKQLQPLYDFMELVTILQINKSVIEATIKIRQEKKIELGDAIIAATAFTHNLTLITRNTADFKNIPNLNIINPDEL